MQLSFLPAGRRGPRAAGRHSSRSLLLATLLCGLAMLCACGGGRSEPAAVQPPPSQAPLPTLAPAGLAYGSAESLYMVGDAISANAPQVTGGAASAFSVSPALPAGLSLDALTGVITGTPTALRPQATYTVTASNAAGSASAQLRLTVTGRGSWTSAAPLLPGRHYFSVSLLRDGRVLASGGYTTGGITASASLFDPATGLWTAAAPMLSPRSDHSATVLPDGKVLVIGGQPVAAGAATASAEIYDPANNTWSATAAMGEPRVRHTATLLGDGSVLVIGGYDGAGLNFSDSMERYDPANGTWTRLNTRMAFARGQHAAELLPGGGTVLVAAGVNRQGFVTSAELVRVDDGGPTTPVAGGGSGNVAQSVRLADGSVLVTTDAGTTAWRFHPGTATWTTSTFGATRSLPTMTALADGRVLLAGGSNLATAEIYNPSVDVWTEAASMATVRRAAAAALLPDGTVLVVGGFSSGAGEVDGVERYAP